jgi:hypothetical protein
MKRKGFFLTILSALGFSTILLVGLVLFPAAKSPSGDVIARKALAAVSPTNDKTIEYVKIRMPDGIFESWHDPVANLWRSQSSDLQGVVSNVTIVSGDRVLQLSPKERSASVTTLSADIVAQNAKLNDEPQLNSLQAELSAEGWDQTREQKLGGRRVYVIERNVDASLETQIDGEVVLMPSLLRYYVDVTSFVIVKEERVDLASGEIVSSNEREYGLVASDQGSWLFDMTVPAEYTVQNVNQPNTYDKND